MHVTPWTKPRLSYILFATQKCQKWEALSTLRAWRTCCLTEMVTTSLESMCFQLWGIPFLPTWEFILSYRSSKSPWDGTDSCTTLAQLGVPHSEWLPSLLLEESNWRTEKLSDEEGAGSLPKMGLMWWKKAQNSELPNKDKHPPDKCLSRISNTKILRFTETELEETSWESTLCTLSYHIFFFMNLHKLSLKTE